MTCKSINPLIAFMTVMVLLAWAGTDQARAENNDPEKVVFADHFQNGQPTDSDSTPGFWRFDQTAAPSIKEADGQPGVTITADGAAKIVSVWMRSALRPAFNFFKKRLKFAVAVQMTGTAPAEAKMMRFVLTADPGKMNYISPDALAVRYDGVGNLQLSWKLNAPNKSPEDPTMGHVLAGVKLPEPLQKFDLELDATTYKLVVYYGTQSQTFSGNHGIDPAQWGAAGTVGKGLAVTHDSAIELETLRVNAPDASTHTVTTWQSVVVTEAVKPSAK